MTHTVELTSPTQEIASPRIRFGKISENSTHMPGPSENAKLATNPSMPISTSIELCASSSTWKPYAASSMKAPMPARAEHQQAAGARRDR